MKTTNIIERLCLFLLVLVLAAPTWAQGNEITIGSKEDWKMFCNRVNRGETNLNVKMTQDIDLGSDIVMVGTQGQKYDGSFDGQGHTLTIDWNTGSADGIAPILYVNGATIRNLHTKGRITSSGSFLSGLIFAAFGTNTISGCVSDVILISSYKDGPCRVAGMVHHVRSDARVEFTDCVVKGTFDATTQSGKQGMAGFIYQQFGTCTLTNCLYLGTNNATNEFSYTFGKNANLKNCYYLNACGEAQGTPVTKEQLESGYMAHLLQGTRSETVWGQVLGTDTIPQLTDKIEKRVHKVAFTLNSEVKATCYANNGSHVASLPTAEEILGAEYSSANTYRLVFAEGFSAATPVDKDRTVAVSFIVNDSFEIATKGDWKAYCDLVESGQALNAKMTADIDLGKDVWIVGSTYSHYISTFDGQGHTLTVDWTVSGYDQGYPFRILGDGATIKNLRVKGKIMSEYGPIAGLAGVIEGNVTFSGCVSDVELIYNDNTPQSLSGMVRWTHNGKVTFTDCLVKGTLNATTENGKKGMGGFVGQQDGTCELNNCLYAGTSNAGEDSYTFAPGANANNSYYLTPCGTAQGTKAIEKELRNGVMIYKLQAGRTDDSHWAQVLGGMPDLYRAADKNVPNYVYYDAANSRWACENFVLTDGQLLPIGIDFLATKATYERPFTKMRTATLCLPYELPISGFKGYTISGGEGNRAYFEEVTGTLEAYRPYYFVADGEPQLGGTNLQVKAYDDTHLKTTTPKGYNLTGTMDGVDNATAAAANAYILQDDGLFHKVTTEYPAAVVPIYRAYITCPKASGAKEISVVLDGETTGIDGVTNDATDGKNGPVYDLQGRRMADRLDDATRNSLPAGVYIVGGRKVIVK